MLINFEDDICIVDDFLAGSTYAHVNGVETGKLRRH